MKIKNFLLAGALASLVGCANTADQNDTVDYGDEVETPDVMLQDTSGKTVKHGDKDYGLAADAKERDQQVTPDPLEGDLVSKRESKPMTVKPKAKVKPKKPMTDEDRHTRDSVLEVEDPLLGEVEPA